MAKKMNTIEKLIAELCPEGVEFKELGEVCIIKTGQAVNKIDISQNPGEFPVINSGREPLGFIDKYNTEDDPIGITTRGAGVGSVTWSEGKFFRGNLNYSVTINDLNQLNTRFLYHLLLQDQTGIQQLATYQGIPALNKSNLEKLKIPNPPLAIQQEIVKILDTFTTLEAKLKAELEAELEARKKQYEYYRDELLTFGGDVEWNTLGEVAKVFSGATPASGVAAYWENGIIPWMSSGEVNKGTIYDTEKKIAQLGYDSCGTKMVPSNTVVVALAGQGKTRGKVARTRIPLCTNQSLCAIISNKTLDSDFLYYFLQSQYQQLRSVSAGDGGRGGLNLQMIKNYRVPIPPLVEQHRIVSILDKFDALVNDIAIGLPAELVARCKQYEYYRNKLLTFKLLEEDHAKQ